MIWCAILPTLLTRFPHGTLLLGADDLAVQLSYLSTPGLRGEDYLVWSIAARLKHDQGRIEQCSRDITPSF